MTGTVTTLPELLRAWYAARREIEAAFAAIDTAPPEDRPRARERYRNAVDRGDELDEALTKAVEASLRADG